MTPLILELQKQIKTNNFQKIKEEAILEHYKEKIKNQIQYTPADRERLRNKINLYMLLRNFEV